MTSGLFIVFEGFDFSGTTTQQEMLTSWLRSQDKYNEVFQGHEPTKNAKEIIRLLKEGKNPREVDNFLMAEGYINDRIQHTRELILPALKSGAHVIEDRYRMSTDAYQWTQGIPLNKLLEMQKNENIIKPDLTILLDIDVKTFLKRAKRDKKRSALELFEKDPKFVEECIDNYRTLVESEYKLFPKEYGEVVVIDGRPKPKKVHADIIDAVDPIYDLWCDYNN